MRAVQRWVVVVVAAFAIAFFASPKSAKACGGGSAYGGGSSGMDGLVITVAIVGLGIAATDVGMGVYDIGKGVAGEHTGKGYAIFETSFAGAQSALIWSVVGSSGSHVDWSPAMVALVAIPSALTLHGILTLSTVDWGAEQAKASPPPDPAAVPYGNVPYAPDAPPAPPPAPSPATTQHDTPQMPPGEDRLRIRFMPTMLPSGTPGNVSLAPGIAAFGTF